MVRSRRLTVEKLDSRQLLAADSFGQVPSTVELRYEEQVIVGSSNEFGRLHDWNIVVDWYFPCSNQTDVNSDGSVSLDDVLAIVNHLNSGADYRVELGLSQNGDNSPLGALLDINHLNTRAGSAVAQHIDVVP